MAKKKDLSEVGQQAAKALNELQLAVRFFRLYPHEHRFCTEAIAKAIKAFQSFAKAHGPLEFTIRREGLFVDEELVQAEGVAMSSDLNSLLYTEGVRELIFEPELSPEEMTRFVEILSAPYPEGDMVSFADDLLTALWREDFEAIEYRIFDPLAASFVRDRRDLSAIGAIAERIRGLVVELGGSLGEEAEGEPPPPAGQKAFDVDAFLRELEERESSVADESLNWASRADMSRAYLESEDGLQRRLLIDELALPEVNDMLGRAAEVVVWSLDDSEGLVGDRDAARFLAGSTLHALSRGDLGQATRLTEWVQAADRGRGTIAPKVLTRLAQADSLSSLSSTLAARIEGASGQIALTEGLQYLARLGAHGVDATCSHYPTIEDPRVRRVYREFLESRIAESATGLASLATHDDPAIAREAIDALGSQGTESQGFSRLRDLVAAGGSAAAFALEKVDELTGETERRALLATVAEGAHRRERLEALATLAERPTAKTFAGLVPILEGRAILERDRDEQEAIVALMARSGGPRTRVVFDALLKRRVPLLVKRQETIALQEIVQRHLDAYLGRREPRA